MSINSISDMIINVAKQEILPRFRKLAQDDITEKSPGDMVSIADTAAEISLSKALKNMFPGAIITGEEAIAARAELLGMALSARQAFLIDPIDGTGNFIKGDERFALMVTEMRKGEAVAAWIYLPVYDKMVVAEKNSGAFIGGEKVKIPSRKFDPAHMIAAAHIRRFPEDLRATARENLQKFNHNSPAFCAGYDYISLVEGKKDFSLYYRTLAWDHLPGSLIYAEAGGYVRTVFNEGNYTAHDLNKGLLSAPNKEQWQDIREIIFPGFF